MVVLFLCILYILPHLQLPPQKPEQQTNNTDYFPCFQPRRMVYNFNIMYSFLNLYSKKCCIYFFRFCLFSIYRNNKVLIKWNGCNERSCLFCFYCTSFLNFLFHRFLFQSLSEFLSVLLLTSQHK